MHVEVVGIILVHVDLEVRKLILNLGGEDQVVCGEDLKVRPILVLLLLGTVQRDVRILIVGLVVRKILDIAENSKRLPFPCRDVVFVVIVVEVVLLEGIVVQAIGLID